MKRKPGLFAVTLAFGVWGAVACTPMTGGSEAAPANEPAAAGPIDVVHVPPPGGGDRPWSNAVHVGDLIFLAGKLGTGADGQLVEGGIQAETRQTMDTIKGLVEAEGSSMDRVAKCTVFLADMAEWPAMNEVYVTYFPEGKRPARSAVAVSGLARDARVEIECIAVKK